MLNTFDHAHHSHQMKLADGHQQAYYPPQQFLLRRDFDYGQQEHYGPHHFHHHDQLNPQLPHPNGWNVPYAAMHHPPPFFRYVRQPVKHEMTCLWIEQDQASPKKPCNKAFSTMHEVSLRPLLISQR